jgi:antirestriction protein
LIFTTKGVTAMTSEYRIYVASLSDYNNGVLHGRWIDIDGTTTVDEIWDEVNEMLAESPTAKKHGEKAEEWEIHDHEGFDGLDLGAWDSFEDYIHHAEMLEEYGEAWRVYVGYVGNGYATKENFEDSYRGAYRDEEDFAYELVDELGYLDNVPDTVRNYFDYASFARDLFISDCYGEHGSDGKFHVFWC